MEWSLQTCLHGTHGLKPLKHFEEGEWLLKAAPEARLGTLPVESAEGESPGTEDRLPSDQRNESHASAGLGAPPSTASSVAQSF